MSTDRDSAASQPASTPRAGPPSRSPIRAMRAELASAVRRAGAGERTVITVGGAPVAQLGPLDHGAPALDALVASGAVIPPRRTSTWRPPAPVPTWSGVRIDRALSELRG